MKGSAVVEAPARAVAGRVGAGGGIAHGPVGQHADLVDDAKDLSHKVAEKADDVWDQAKDKASDLVQDAKDLGSKLADQAEDAMDKAVDKAEDLATNIGSKISSKAEEGLGNQTTGEDLADPESAKPEDKV